MTTKPKTKIATDVDTADRRAPVGTAEREQMMAIAVRNRKVYESVQEWLSVSAVKKFSPALALVWKQARRFYTKHGELPTKSQLNTSLHQYATENPHTLSAEETEEIDEFLEYAFNDAEHGKNLPTSNVAYEVAVNTFKALLQDQAVRDVSKQLTEGGKMPVDAGKALRAKADEIDAAAGVSTELPNAETVVDELKQWRASRKGKPLGGLSTGDERFDRATDGLKGLSIVAGMEGTGKTSRVMQTVKGVLSQPENDAVCVVVSLDMQRKVLLGRTVCAMAGVDFKTYTRGDLTKAQAKKVTKAEDKLSAYGNNLVVIGAEAGQTVNASTLSTLVKRAKDRAGRSRSLLVVDYFQLLAAAGLDSLDADRFRVDELKRVVASGVRDGDDYAAVVAISEMRKRLAGAKNTSADSSDIMGSTRIKYAAEAVLLMSQATDTEMSPLWIATRNKKGVELAALMKQKRKQLHQERAAYVVLNMAKGRDGTERGEWMERFNYDLYTFEPAEGEVPVADEGE